jgi:hypothetical protein
LDGGRTMSVGDVEVDMLNKVELGMTQWRYMITAGDTVAELGCNVRRLWWCCKVLNHQCAASVAVLIGRRMEASAPAGSGRWSGVWLSADT